jgi:hypothetical protein
MADQQRKTSSLTGLPQAPRTVRNAPLPSDIEQEHVRLARLAGIAVKWRDLAERRRRHFIELNESGRWKHYYTDQEFLDELRNAVATAERWSTIASQSERLASAAEMELPRPKAA